MKTCIIKAAYAFDKSNIKLDLWVKSQKDFINIDTAVKEELCKEDLLPHMRLSELNCLPWNISDQDYPD